MHIIKRYSNRKLYDTVEKHYITLENIESMIKQGEEIQIVDNDSGEDITAATLSQIIVEQTRKSNVYAPSVFVDLIRKSSDTMYDYAKKMLHLGGEPASADAAGFTDKQNLESKDANYLESLMSSVLTKFHIPARSDVDKLSQTIERLEKCVQGLEGRWQEQESKKEPEKQSSEVKNP